MVGVEEHGLTLHSSDHGLIIALVDLAQQRDHSGAEAEALHSLVVVAGLAEPVPQVPGMTQVLLGEVLIGKIVILLDALEAGKIALREADHQDSHDEEDECHGDGVQAEEARSKEAEEQEPAGIALKDGQQHHADADCRKHAAHDAQCIEDAAAQCIRHAVEGIGAEVQDDKDDDETDNGLDNVRNPGVCPDNELGLALLDPLVSQRNEHALAGHGQNFDHSADKAHRNGQCQSGVRIEAADQSECSTHDTGHAGVSRQRAAGGDEAEVDDVDGRADDRALNRVAEDQADDKAANERTVDRCPLAHGTKRPADVREAIEQRDQANLQDTDIHKFSLLISILGFTAKAVPPLGSELRERGSGVGPAVYFNSFLTSSFASDGTIWQ